jgi:hypothetical protein
MSKILPDKLRLVFWANLSRSGRKLWSFAKNTIRGFFYPRGISTRQFANPIVTNSPTAGRPWLKGRRKRTFEAPRGGCLTESQKIL